MLPIQEIDTLTHAVTEALDRAARGYPADGYEVLLAGMHRAQELHEAGMDGSDALVDYWRAALEGYAERFHIGRA
jgi:hypothetical protein